MTGLLTKRRFGRGNRDIHASVPLIGGQGERIEAQQGFKRQTHRQQDVVAYDAMSRGTSRQAHLMDVDVDHLVALDVLLGEGA